MKVTSQVANPIPHTIPTIPLCSHGKSFARISRNRIASRRITLPSSCERRVSGSEKKTPGSTTPADLAAPVAPAAPADSVKLEELLEQLAIEEHDRWVAEKRRNGWIAAPCHERECRNDQLLLHNCLFPWEELTEEQKKFDRDTVRQIPHHLGEAECEIVNL